MIQINRQPSRRQLRQFAGIWFPAFWALVGLILWRRLGLPGVASTLWGIAAVLSIAGLAHPPFMRPVYLGMIYLTFPIGWVVSNLLLLVIYYLILTPLALGMRLLGRDPMQRRLDRSAATYWLPREQQSDVRRYFRQY